MMKLDDPERFEELRSRISAKPLLKAFYSAAYRRFEKLLERCPIDGGVVEIGSGGGFARQVVRDLITSDVIPYTGVNCIVDATKMPFSTGSLRGVFLLNVFHHIADVSLFLGELQRCLMPGGRVLIVDQYPGWFARPILKYIHHEDFDVNVNGWRFPSSGPLSSANGALPWIVFVRDLEIFQARYPGLEMLSLTRHTPLSYWASGGLRKWSLLPGSSERLMESIDHSISRWFPEAASFMDVELLRRA